VGMPPTRMALAAQESWLAANSNSTPCDSASPTPPLLEGREGRDREETPCRTAAAPNSSSSGDRQPPDEASRAEDIAAVVPDADGRAARGPGCGTGVSCDSHGVVGGGGCDPACSADVGSMSTRLAAREDVESEPEGGEDGKGGEAALRQLEQTHVHEVYDVIAPHFSATRFAVWPKVRALFLVLLVPLMVRVSCGGYVLVTET
jgi:hypothetical protein